MMMMMMMMMMKIVQFFSVKIFCFYAAEVSNKKMDRKIV